MTIINKNKPNFLGNDGEILANGYIYIGLPSQDPIAFPKTVTFTDSGGNEFTASQPLRTNQDGQIVYNGLAIIASTDGNYSQLIQDYTQTDIRGGYTPLITEDSGATTDLDDYTESGLLLADVKQLDKTPGQTVKSIGKTSTEDGLGALWLVISATASPADDIDLIDFDNGTQGQRIKNYLGSGDYLQEIADAGTSAQETARSNMGITEYITSFVIDLSGTFSAGSVQFTKYENQVTCSVVDSLVRFVSNTTSVSDAGIVPAAYRPSVESDYVYEVSGSTIKSVTISTAGTITTSSYDWAGSGLATVNYGEFNISYHADI